MQHIAIFRQPFFDMILCGEKTIESRWSIKKIAPYKKVNIGDEILFKESGKDITASAQVKDVKYFELTPDIANDIRQKYGKQIGIDKFEDWHTTLHKKYCTLIWFENIKKLQPIKVKKNNRAGWLVIR